MSMLFNREPVLYLALVESGLVMAVGFGLNLSKEQVALIVAFSSAVLGFIARQRVTPVGRARAKTDQTN